MHDKLAFVFDLLLVFFLCNLPMDSGRRGEVE
jgi:hypothetical protein